MKYLLAILLTLYPLAVTGQQDGWVLLGAKQGSTFWHTTDLQGDPYSLIYDDRWMGAFAVDTHIYSRVLWPMPSKTTRYSDTFKVRVRAGAGVLVWVITGSQHNYYDQFTGVIVGDDSLREYQWPVVYPMNKRPTMIGLGIPKWRVQGVELNVRDTVWIDCAWYRYKAKDTVGFDTTRIDSTLSVEGRKVFDFKKETIRWYDILGRHVFTGTFAQFEARRFRGVFFPSKGTIIYMP